MRFQGIIPAILYVLLGLPILADAFYYNIADIGHVVLKAELGKIDSVHDSIITYFPYSTGLQFKINEDIDTSKLLTCTSKEGIPITYKEILVGNQIDRNKVLSTIQRYGLNYDQTKIVAIVEKFLQEICRKYKYTELEIEKSTEVQNLLKEKLQDEHTTLDTGVTITFVRMSNAIIPQTLQDERQRLNEETSKQFREKAETETQRLQKIKLAEGQTADNPRAMNTTLAAIEQERLKTTRENERMIEVAKTKALELGIIAAAESAANILKESHTRNMYAIEAYAIKEQLTAVFKEGSVIYIGGENNPAKMIEMFKNVIGPKRSG
jgi:hypothetical protein